MSTVHEYYSSTVRRLGQQIQKILTSFIVIQLQNMQLIIRYDNWTA